MQVHRLLLVALWSLCTLSQCEDSVIQKVCRSPSYRLSAERRYEANSANVWPGTNPRADVVGMLNNRRVLEIGGPSMRDSTFKAIYTHAGSVDNVNQHNHFKHFYQHFDSSGAQKNMGEIFDQSPYVVNGQTLGVMYQRHGNNLEGIPSEWYDAVISSHTLEHFVDPLAALLEWDRVLAPGGFFFVVLPWAPMNIDKYTEPSTAQELMHIHALSLRGGLDQAFLKRRLDIRLRLFPEYLAKTPYFPHDDNSTGGHKTWENRRKFLANKVMSKCPARWSRGRLYRPPTCGQPEIDEALYHWHTWDLDLMQEIFGDCFGYNILKMSVDATHPVNQFLLAVKP
eukprot:TRINITY_DN55132_c0_g1_i1.p1 TRINITY_DN55132_c0_g1~~TRINITY_DN55132_c0_g1_i1.p1  ORF type:complete len:340 (-),score=20.35 TRINITY_DN55132_c0_g1_i1:159-1178(-)